MVEDKGVTEDGIDVVFCVVSNDNEHWDVVVGISDDSSFQNKSPNNQDITDLILGGSSRRRIVSLSFCVSSFVFRVLFLVSCSGDDDTPFFETKKESSSSLSLLSSPSPPSPPPRIRYHKDCFVGFMISFCRRRRRHHDTDRYRSYDHGGLPVVVVVVVVVLLVRSFLNVVTAAMTQQ